MVSIMTPQNKLKSLVNKTERVSVTVLKPHPRNPSPWYCEGVHKVICSVCGVEADATCFIKDHGSLPQKKGRCKICAIKARREYYQSNNEEKRRKRREYTRANPELIAKQRAKHKYGITDEEYKIIKSESAKCAICLSKKKLVIDHDHESGAFRGVLCTICNSAIGFLCDDTLLLKRAIEYLQSSYEDVQANGG